MYVYIYIYTYMYILHTCLEDEHRGGREAGRHARHEAHEVGDDPRRHVDAEGRPEGRHRPRARVGRDLDGLDRRGVRGRSASQESGLRRLRLQQTLLYKGRISPRTSWNPPEESRADRHPLTQRAVRRSVHEKSASRRSRSESYCIISVRHRSVSLCIALHYIRLYDII